MTELVILLAGVVAAAGAARATGFSPLPFYLVAGLLLPLAPDAPGSILIDILVLGATFLLFAAGMALTPGRARHHRRAVLVVGGTQFALLGGAGFLVTLAAGYGYAAAIYLGLALAASSTLVGVRVLRRRGEMFDPVGRLSLGVLLLQDVLVILSVPLLAALGTAAGGVDGDGGTGARLASAATALLGSLLLIAVARALHLGTPRLAALRRGLPDEEAWLILPIALLFAFLGVGSWLGVPPPASAFLAGYALAGFPVAGIVRPKLASVSDFFTALFFTALGAAVTLPSAATLGLALVFVVLLVIITPAVFLVLGRRLGFAHRTALLAGLLLAQTSELSLILGLYGVESGVLDAEAQALLVLVTALTMLATPTLASDQTLALLSRLRRPAPEPASSPPPGHVLLLGCGANGHEVLDLLRTAGKSVTVIDMDRDVVEAISSDDGILAREGEAGDPQLLRWAAPERALAVVSTVRRVRDNRALLDGWGRGDVPIFVRTFGEADEAWARAKGGIPVPFDRATSDDLWRWVEGEGVLSGARGASGLPAPPGSDR